MQNSALTTHVGSLVRPSALVASRQAADRDQAYDQQALATQIARSVAEVVQQLLFGRKHDVIVS